MIERARKRECDWGRMLREREQKSWNEKYSVMLSWVGSMCLHVQSHLPSAVCWCDCRHRLALHNSFKDVSMKMHQCNGTQKNSVEPKETARKKYTQTKRCNLTLSITNGLHAQCTSEYNSIIQCYAQSLSVHKVVL